MPSLFDLQHAFVAELFDERHKQCLGLVVENRFRAEELMQVYRNNMLISLTGALQAVYPVSQRLVGAGFFAYAADSYIRQHPSRSGNLHEFGASFAEFLRAFAPARELVYLPDVARLEWAWHEVYHGPDQSPMDLTKLSVLTPSAYEALRFVVHPGMRLIESRFPILRIWLANRDEATSPEPIELDEGTDHLLLRREGMDVVIERLDIGSFRFLEQTTLGITLVDALAAATTAEPGFDLGRCLERHALGGTLVDVLIEAS